MPYIPNNLREYRQKAGLLQKDVAAALGIASTDRISRWEKGLAYPSVRNLMTIAKFFCVSIEELYSIDDLK